MDIMKITLNNRIIELPQYGMNIVELLKSQQIPTQATAIAVNQKIVRRDNWEITHLKENDSVTVISAAFGG